jgi:ATP-dependent Clp protease ATP-binding subunit ClpA
MWLDAALPEPLAEMEAALNARVIGQGVAISQVVRAIARYRAGLAGLERPVAAFLLLGPTGTGKTLTAEALAESLHGTPAAMLKVHCAEFRSEHELARLKGSPPGYVGWKECVPVLHETKLREARICDTLAVVLFDEVEKAHPALWDLLLGLLDKGEVVLNDNTHADFRRTIVFLTGNAGAREMADRLSGGYGFSAGTPHARIGQGGAAAVPLEGIASRAVDRLFSPEFRNRLTGVLTYRPLEFEQVTAICSLELRRLSARLAAREHGPVGLSVSPAALQRVARDGYDPRCGARHVKRAIERLVEEPLANILAAGRVASGATVTVCDGDTLRFHSAACAGD